MGRFVKTIGLNGKTARDRQSHFLEDHDGPRHVIIQDDRSIESAGRHTTRHHNRIRIDNAGKTGHVFFKWRRWSKPGLSFYQRVHGKHGVVDGDYIGSHLRPWGSFKAKWGWLIVSIIIAAMILTCFGGYKVPSGSMLPTLEIGGRFVGDRVRPWLGVIHRGDVVVFHDDMGWMDGTPTQGQRLVKRVIGLPGDHVESDGDGVVKVNGKALTAPPYGNGSLSMEYSVDVPAGRLFVLGDNRDHSADSRFHADKDDGTIPVSSVEAILIAQVFPLKMVHLVH